MANRNNRLDAQISQTDKVLFCLGACRLSAENRERASEVSDEISTSQNFDSGKKNQLKKKKKKKKKKTEKKKKNTAGLRGWKT